MPGNCLVPVDAVDPPAAVVQPGSGVTFINLPPGFIFVPPTSLQRDPAAGVPPATPVTRLTVSNASDQPATVTFERELTIAVAASAVVQVLGPAAAACAAVDGHGSIVRCREVPAPYTRLTFTTNSEPVQLRRGCTVVVLTWPVGTPIRRVWGAITPPEALESILTLDPARGTFRGFSTGPIPAFVNDYTAVERPLEAAFICMREDGTLNRPSVQNEAIAVRRSPRGSVTTEVVGPAAASAPRPPD